MSFGKSRAKMNTENKIKVTFQDVAGADEEKEDHYSDEDRHQDQGV